jgi:hypothetical protein
MRPERSDLKDDRDPKYMVLTQGRIGQATADECLAFGCKATCSTRYVVRRMSVY